MNYDSGVQKLVHTKESKWAMLDGKKYSPAR